MMKLIKRMLSALLVCLLLCGLVMPAAWAEDGEPAFSIEDAQPLEINVAMPVSAGDVFSYTPDETGWVKFTLNPERSFSLAIFDDELIQLFSYSAGSYMPFSGFNVKAIAGKTL